MSDIPSWVAIAAAGGGLLTAIAVIVKARPEAGQIVVSAAQGAVIVQTGVIASLREDLERERVTADQALAEAAECRASMHRLESELEAMRALRQRVADLETALAERDRALQTARRENDRLRQRVATLEDEVRELRKPR